MDSQIVEKPMAPVNLNHRGEAWIWVRQLADSMIVFAAALTVIGVDLRPYFDAQGLGAGSEYNVEEVQSIRTDNVKLQANSLALIETNKDINAQLLELKARLEAVESVAHHPGKSQRTINEDPIK